MKYPALIFLVLVCILVEATSCASVAPNTGSVDEFKADLAGQILEIYQAGPLGTENGQLGAILVEGTIEDGAQNALVSVVVIKDTQLWQQDGQARRSITFDSLTVSQHVQIAFRGPVAESYPMQATADEILVTQ